MRFRAITTIVHGQGEIALPGTEFEACGSEMDRALQNGAAAIISETAATENAWGAVDDTPEISGESIPVDDPEHPACEPVDLDVSQWGSKRRRGRR